MIKALVAFECSGNVRRALRLVGMDAYSCDLKPADDHSPYHIQGDVRTQLGGNWDLMIAHPPCTFLAYSGARWWKRDGWREQQEQALGLFWTVLNAPIACICVENPRGLPLKAIRAADDIIEPYEFGEPYKKRTYLWLKNLPPLMKSMLLTTYEVDWTTHQTKDRQNARSVTFQGIANAMAWQWRFVPAGA